jgi:hypothetical protein
MEASERKKRVKEIIQKTGKNANEIQAILDNNDIGCKIHNLAYSGRPIVSFVHAAKVSSELSKLSGISQSEIIRVIADTKGVSETELRFIKTKKR